MVDENLKTLGTTAAYIDTKVSRVSSGYPQEGHYKKYKALYS